MTNLNTTPGARPAIPPRYATVNTASGKAVHPDVIVHLEVAEAPWGDPRKTPHQKWDVYLGDEIIVSRHRDPSHAACRALLARGITGMVMDIEGGAKLSVFDDDRRGLRVGKYHPYDGTDNAPAGELIGEGM